MKLNRSPYSANVALRLVIAGQALVLSQVGPGFVVLREQILESIGPGEGRVDVIIDNSVASSNTHFFPHGVQTGLKELIYW
ncbi:hypothetical protein [Stieleria varia]|uniref:hypothetical protein n=1 Tax=Stieleria varia TaxID=2528005 RepID=UPI0011B83A1F|nr:hypothetical protein [Stieleria varia]